MNLSTFRTRVGRAIGLSTSDSDDLALIDSFVNEAVVQFLKDTKVNVLKASLSVTAGSSDYTLDTDILSLTDVWFDPYNGQETLLEPRDSRDIVRMRLFESAADVSPRYYGMQGAHLLMLHPAPASNSDLLHILYVPRPSSVLSATADSPAGTAYGNIPEEYHPTVEAYAKWKAAQAEEHKPSKFGEVFQTEYDLGISRVKADMNRKAGVFLPRKLVGRAPRWPVTPGTDLR